MKKRQLPTPQEAVDQFAKRHYILNTELVQRDHLAIYWTTAANILVHSGHNSLPDKVLVAEPTVGLLLNMLDRTFEHVEGAIVAYDTGSMASSEVIARTAVESAINAMYIMAGDKVSRLAAYFYSYLDSSGNQVNKWLKTITRMSGAEAQAHREAANRRQGALKNLKAFVDHAISQMPSSEKNTQPFKWPNTIVERFNALGLESTYRTVYVRMSSQTHNDAEDTLNYFLAVAVGDERLKERMGLETVNFSRFLVYYGVSFYIEASIKYAESFRMADTAEELKQGKSIIERQMQEISLEIGAF